MSQRKRVWWAYACTLLMVGSLSVTAATEITVRCDQGDDLRRAVHKAASRQTDGLLIVNIRGTCNMRQPLVVDNVTDRLRWIYLIGDANSGATLEAVEPLASRSTYMLGFFGVPTVLIANLAFRYDGVGVVLSGAPFGDVVDCSFQPRTQGGQIGIVAQQFSEVAVVNSTIDMFDYGMVAWSSNLRVSDTAVQSPLTGIWAEDSDVRLSDGYVTSGDTGLYTEYSRSAFIGAPVSAPYSVIALSSNVNFYAQDGCCDSAGDVILWGRSYFHSPDLYVNGSVYSLEFSGAVLGSVSGGVSCWTGGDAAVSGSAAFIDGCPSAATTSATQSSRSLAPVRRNPRAALAARGLDRPFEPEVPVDENLSFTPDEPSLLNWWLRVPRDGGR